MRIILEGLDASGKSTLGAFLSKELDLPIRYAGGPPGNRDIVVERCIEQHQYDDCIFDRVTSISERAYRIDISDDLYDELSTFTEMLISRGCLVVWCTGCGNHELKGHDTEEHVRHITENADIIAKRYIKIFRDIPYFSFNFKFQKMEEVLEWLKQQRNMRSTK